jgi:hypothetical protein
VIPIHVLVNPGRGVKRGGGREKEGERKVRQGGEERRWKRKGG